MNAQQLRNHVSQQCGFTPNRAKTSTRIEPQPQWKRERAIVIGKHYDGTYCYHADVCHLVPLELGEVNNKAQVPESFEDWLKQGNDAIDDPGGNIIPSRVLANHDQYDNERHPFN